MLICFSCDGYHGSESERAVGHSTTATAATGGC